MGVGDAAGDAVGFAVVGLAAAGVGLAVGEGLVVGVGLAGGVGGGVVCWANVRVEAATTTASAARNGDLAMRLPSEPGVSGTEDTF